MISDFPDEQDEEDDEEQDAVDEIDLPDESNTLAGLVYLDDDERISPDAILTAATGRMNEVVIMGAGVDGAFWFAASHGKGRADEIRKLLERGLAILNT